MLQVSYGRFAPTITPGQDLPCKALSSPPHTEWCHPAEAAGLLKPKAALGGTVGSPDMGGTAATELCTEQPCLATKQGGVGDAELGTVTSPPSPPASPQRPSPGTGMSLVSLQLVIVTSCSRSWHRPSQGREELWGSLCALPRLHFPTTRLPSSARKLSFPNTY